jgi:hypothetical protein
METPGNEGTGNEGTTDPTQQMPPPPTPPPPGYGGQQMMIGWPAGARMPIPGNAEWALWFVVEILFAIIWASSDEVGASEFVIATAIVTFGYLISRGIAKAGRVLEH